MKTLKIKLSIVLMCISIAFFNWSCDDTIEELSKPDFKFISGDITCPPHTNYQIGWEANVKNIGNASAEAKVQAWLSHDKNLGDDKAAGGKVFGTIDANGNISSSFGATIGSVGDYKYLLLQIDHENTVDESDETNNVLVITIPEGYPNSMCDTATPKPDFAFISGDITCPPHTNYQIGWEANVKNIGNASAEAKVQAWLSHDKDLGDDKPAGGRVFATIDANGTFQASFGATIGSVGNYKYLLLQIDHENTVDESDETNNVLAITIPEGYPNSMCETATPKPDFAFISGDITCPPHSNYQIGWEANVKNIGNASAEAKVQAWLSHDKDLGDDKPAGGRVFATIDANGTFQASFGATIGSVGNYKYLLLQIDHENTVDESDETNNVLAITIPKDYPVAMCKPGNFNAISCEDINYNKSKLSGNPIIATDASGHNFKNGDVLIYKTNQNRHGKLQIVTIEDGENKRLTINAVTYNEDGSIYKQTNGLKIRGTWYCDLDAMIETERGVTAARDFFWERVSNEITHFTPQNNAVFYKYEF